MSDITVGALVEFWTRRTGERATRVEGRVRAVSGDKLYARVEYPDGVTRPIETSRLRVCIEQPTLPDIPAATLPYGAHVVLRSGGPIMTVLSHEGDDYLCEWTDGEGDTCTDTFARSTLDLHEAIYNVCALRCTECHVNFTADEVARENPLDWGHPCRASALIAVDPATTTPPRRSVRTALHCESFRERVPILKEEA